MRWVVLKCKLHLVNKARRLSVSVINLTSWHIMKSITHTSRNARYLLICLFICLDCGIRIIIIEEYSEHFRVNLLVEACKTFDERMSLCCPAKLWNSHCILIVIFKMLWRHTYSKNDFASSFQDFVSYLLPCGNLKQTTADLEAFVQTLRPRSRGDDWVWWRHLPRNAIR